MTSQLPTAVFGGAFDPPHIGHALVVGSLLNANLVERVIVVPSGKRSDKTYLAADYHRRAMTELVFHSSLFPKNKVSVSTVELDNPQICGTYELFEQLRKGYAETKFSFVIGSDLLSELHTWRHTEKLRDKISFIALYRGGVEQKDVSGFSITPHVQEVATSHASSFIRNVIQQEGSLAGLVTSEVGRYIEHNDLYRS
jgi:nicotinate-nucleotide adenylyltransferase